MAGILREMARRVDDGATVSNNMIVYRAHR